MSNRVRLCVTGRIKHTLPVVKEWGGVGLGQPPNHPRNQPPPPPFSSPNWILFPSWLQSPSPCLFLSLTLSLPLSVSRSAPGPSPCRCISCFALVLSEFSLYISPPSCLPLTPSLPHSLSAPYRHFCGVLSLKVEVCGAGLSPPVPCGPCVAHLVGKGIRFPAQAALGKQRLGPPTTASRKQGKVIMALLGSPPTK